MFKKLQFWLAGWLPLCRSRFTTRAGKATCSPPVGLPCDHPAWSWGTTMMMIMMKYHDHDHIIMNIVMMMVLRERIAIPTVGSLFQMWPLQTTDGFIWIFSSSLSSSSSSSPSSSSSSWLSLWLSQPLMASALTIRHGDVCGRQEDLSKAGKQLHAFHRHRHQRLLHYDHFHSHHHHPIQHPHHHPHHHISHSICCMKFLSQRSSLSAEWKRLQFWPSEKGASLQCTLETWDPSSASLIVSRFGLLKHLPERILLNIFYRPSEKGCSFGSLQCTPETRDPSLASRRSVCLGPACRPDTVGLHRHRRQRKKTCEQIFNKIYICLNHTHNRGKTR